MTSSFTRFLDHTQRRTTVGRTPLDEWSALRKDLYLTTHNTHNRQTSMPPGGIRTHNLSRRAAADLRLRPRGNWDRLELKYTSKKQVVGVWTRISWLKEQLSLKNWIQKPQRCCGKCHEEAAVMDNLHFSWVLYAQPLRTDYATMQGGVGHAQYRLGYGAADRGVMVRFQVGQQYVLSSTTFRPSLSLT